MSSTFQIVQPDGRVGAHVSIENVVSEIAHGRVLGFDLLRSADGSVSTVEEHSACARIIGLLAQRSTSGSRGDLCQQIASIGKNAASGRLLVWSNQQLKQRAFVFRDGLLVCARSSVSGEIEGNGETPQARATRAHETLKALGNTLEAHEQRYSFIEDTNISDTECFAWFDARSALEAALYGHLPSTELWWVAEQLGTAQKTSGFDSDRFDGTDRQIADRVHGREVTRDLVQTVADAINCSIEDVLIRLTIMVAYNAIKGQTSTAPAIRKTALRLRQESYFDVLQVKQHASADEINAAFDKRSHALGALDEPKDDGAMRQARQELRTVLEMARDHLTDEPTRNAYQRAQSLGLDFNDGSVRNRLLKEELLGYADKKLNDNEFEAAYSAFERVVRDHPQDENVLIKLGWATFLKSDRSPSAAREAAVDVERALTLNKESDAAHLTLGKIYRLAQVRDQALKHLQKATEINPNNSEAWALLRNVNTQKGSSGSSPISVQFEVGDGLVPVMMLALMAMALLYVGANVVPGGPKVWPKVGTGSKAAVVDTGKVSKFESEMAAKVRKRLEGEVDYSIPRDQQVLGSVESYYLVDDVWFWARRGGLILFALIGIFGLARKRLGSVPLMGTQPMFVLVAIPYGIVVGFLSPMPATPSGLEVLLSMTLVHIIAEQLFFFGLVGRMLSKSIESPLVAITATAVIFGVYHFTYFGTMQADASTMLMGVAQIGAFAGGAYAALWHFSGGFFAPFLAHLLINGTMMFRTVQQYAG